MASFFLNVYRGCSNVAPSGRVFDLREWFCRWFLGPVAYCLWPMVSTGSFAEQQSYGEIFQYSRELYLAVVVSIDQLFGEDVTIGL